MGPIEHSVFEEGFLVNSIGQIAHRPEVAIAELVANAWDAGASRVEIDLAVRHPSHPQHPSDHELLRRSWGADHMQQAQHRATHNQARFELAAFARVSTFHR